MRMQKDYKRASDEGARFFIGDGADFLLSISGGGQAAASTKQSGFLPDDVLSKIGTQKQKALMSA
ncbi:hypothetical protein [Rhizobium sp. SGZ-381]|uniref:hypothetical protein n=1 Tax=Rhizobium sp. SGZ-381 TaxID=3342800 RepID=UPI003670DCAA